jgi:arginyl-tRNA synthetase
MLDFDFDKVLEQSRENPVWYVQYAHARAQSVLRKAAEMGADDHRPDLSALAHDAELALVRKLAEWPRIVELAARVREPHRVAGYLSELAAEFHGLWNKGNDTPELRFVQDGDPAATATKSALAQASAHVIASGLAVLGVAALDELR